MTTSTSGKSDHLISACKDFSHDTSSLQSAEALVDAVKGGKYDQGEAETALWLLTDLENDNVTKNTAVDTLLATPQGQQAALASFRSRATELFDQLWNCGDTVVDTFTSILLRSEVWESSTTPAQTPSDNNTEAVNVSIPGHYDHD